VALNRGSLIAGGWVGLLSFFLLPAMTRTAFGQIVEWSQQFGSTSHNYRNPAAVDSTGVYAAGYSQQPLPGQTDVGPFPGPFIRKYDAGGAEI
jgi:hypothetical protein